MTRGNFKKGISGKILIKKYGQQKGILDFKNMLLKEPSIPKAGSGFVSHFRLGNAYVRGPDLGNFAYSILIMHFAKQVPDLIEDPVKYQKLEKYLLELSDMANRYSQGNRPDPWRDVEAVKLGMKIGATWITN